MKILLNITVLMMTTFHISMGQTIRELSMELIRLQVYSIEYDRYTNVLKDDPGFEEQRRKATENYQRQIQLITKGPDSKKYEEFLKISIERDSVKLKTQYRYNYTYVSGLIVMPYYRLPNRLDYYKVVYYSLFVKKVDRLLPRIILIFYLIKKLSM